jgi:hypothetical protein
LEYAIHSNDATVIQFFVDRGAKWRFASEDSDDHPLVIAARRGWVETTRKLLELGLRDPRALPLARDPAVRALLEDDAKAADTRLVDDEELWPLICEDPLNWKSRAEAHLAKGGGVNYRSVKWTPLFLAVDAANPDLVKWLLAKGAEPNLVPISLYENWYILDEFFHSLTKLDGEPRQGLTDGPLAEIYTALVRSGAALRSKATMRFYLVTAANCGWAKLVSAMLQSGVSTEGAAEELRQLRPHYTAEQRANVLKLLQP